MSSKATRLDRGVCFNAQPQSGMDIAAFRQHESRSLSSSAFQLQGSLLVVTPDRCRHRYDSCSPIPSKDLILATSDPTQGFQPGFRHFNLASPGNYLLDGYHPYWGHRMPKSKVTWLNWLDALTAEHHVYDTT